MVADWVVAHRPHLVVIELAINDGDTLLETEEPASIGAALEGIVRHIRDALPHTELCLLCMFVRDDLPLHLRTGSKAWADNDDASAAATYHKRIPQLHGRVCERYGIPTLHLSPLMRRLPSNVRGAVFRDDCHLLDDGAAFAAAAISAALREAMCGGSAAAAISALPEPVHAKPWGRGRTQEVMPQELSFFYLKAQPSTPAELQAAQQRLLERHTQMDMDPLNNAQQRAWWLLYPGDRCPTPLLSPPIASHRLPSPSCPCPCPCPCPLLASTCAPARRRPCVARPLSSPQRSPQRPAPISPQDPAPNAHW